ncbi:hypothetical protein CFI11_22285 [Thalassococcus sp. S3]|nr:hypothetical protein CFI11_22285 [Thalassococcus sp. S3]
MMPSEASGSSTTCSLSDTTYTCTGIVYEYDLDLSDVDDTYSTIIFEDLTSWSGGTYVFDIDNVGDEGSSHGDDGEDVDALTVTVDGSDSVLEIKGNDEDPMVSLDTEAGKGHSGKDRTDATSSGDGGNGGDGGDVTGAQVIEIEGGEINGYDNDAYAGASVTAIGGNGGSGGKGRSYGTSNGKGGDGGDGGNAGEAELVIYSDAIFEFLSTEDEAPGIYVSSAGGAGNDGGKGEGGDNAYGGDGGEGGDGDEAAFYAELGATLTIETQGDLSHGIEVLSSGGDGGDGGKGTESLGDAYGGDGGGGGTAGDVAVSIDDATVDIKTTGADAIGILARSYGGAGGDGGDADSTFGTGNGGASDAAGPAGDVFVLFQGSITTTGDGDSSDDDGDDDTTTSSAILAQSVGGFAGDAGDASGFLDAYGASSESAGDAGTVTVEIESGTTISTGGEYSVGIEAQSIGGGGGKAGSGDAITSVGGDGSAGGNGGKVFVEVAGGDDTTITTTKASSAAISAQSIGGGGGKSGGSDGVASVGGTGGTGGDGSVVSITLDADLTTSDDYSEGVIGQSIGGGGGVGHSTDGLFSQIGGSGGDGGSADEVKLTHQGGDIKTDGIYSDGVDLQSIGGGGGKGSSSMDIGVEVSVVVGSSGGDGGDGGTVIYTEDGSDSYVIETKQSHSDGISAQSGGGGGGKSGSVTNVTASVGVGVSVGSSEDGGAGGDGGSVSVDTSAAITTGGDHSDAIFAQSYGGSGGKAGSTVSVDAGIDIAAVSVATGGAGGDGGDASTVDVTSTGTLKTTEDHSNGIFAQSAGGSGGKSSNVYAINSTSIDSVSVATGATGGDGGNAAAVTVTNSGAVSTSKTHSTAIYAQSVGGGGGASGTTFSFDTVSMSGSVAVSVGGDGGDGGSSDTVNVTNYGELTADEDNSDGIFAQSLAGGGGNSGGTYSGTGISTSAVGVSVGGNAGDGDTSGAVTVNNEGNITVKGDNAYAIYAESRGGAGGKSGTTMSFDSISGGAVEVAVGGEGGDGGTAGTVYVSNSGELDVQGKNGVGILASSQGGEGGNSGTVISGSVITGSSASVGIGGGGGEGGIADSAQVYNSGNITTQEDFGYGILTQSVGGAGGNGSTVVNADLFAGVTSDATDGLSGNAQFSLGGSGGDGGVAGEVYAENDANIKTYGDKSYGMLGQSIGGNGGTGGTVYTFDLDLGTQSSLNAEVSIGGSGADGSQASTVQLFNDGSIYTEGLYAHGVFGQSLGGSGGAGGSVSAYTISTSEQWDFGISVAVGGEGGDGAVGSQVTIENTGDITVTGEGAAGVYAQSLGGDGGDGGSATAVLLGITATTGKSTALNVSTSVGGAGGTGNDADKVKVTNSGTITTVGATGDGIFAQSVGGGGGDGGAAEATSIGYMDNPEEYSTTSIEVAFDLGGSGGSGGDGGVVEVINDGQITTNLDSAIGIFAQSVGGGGGTGGEAGTTSDVDGDNWDTWIDLTEVVATDFIDELVSAYTLYSLYSDYSGYFTNWTVSVGGSGGAAGDGDTVTVTSSSQITTSGVDSTAIYAQSVGGGGGTGGTGTGTSIISKAEVGGDGGSGGHGDDVTVSNSGGIKTGGERAHGIWAQSVGGGGGDAGDVEGAFGASVADAFDVNLSLSIGASYDGDAGNGGDGGNVKISSTEADIEIGGDYGIGIWGQSVGGGGGTSGSIALFEFYSGSAGAEGDSGDVTVDLDDANITTTGDYAIGVFAQSSSGSYNSSDLSDADDDDTYFTYDGDDSYDAGDIAITLTDGSSIDVSGEMSRGILAASSGYDSSGTISIDVDADSSITASDGNAHVIELYDGTSNVLTNYGTIEDGDFTDTSRTDSVYVIRTKTTSDDYDSSGTAGNAALTVDNYGTISGSVKFVEDTTASTFTNHSDGTFNLGTTIDLGSGGGLLTNNGTLSPGGVGEIFTSTISDGDLEQSSTGILLVDLDMNGSDDDEDADLLIASSIPTFDGSIEVNVTSSDDAEDGDSGSVFILVADDLDEDADLSVPDSAIVDYEVTVETDDDITVDDTTYSGKDGVLLSYTIDVGSSGASVNTTNLSSYLTSASDDDDDTSSDDTSTVSASALSSVSFAASSAASEDTSADPGSDVKEDMRAVFTDLLNARTVDDLNSTAASHIIDETGAAVLAARNTSQSMHNTLRSCPNLRRSHTKPFLEEQDCAWFEIVGTDNRYDNSAGTTGLDERTYGLSFGGQRRTDSGVILGGLFRAEDVTLTGDGLRQTGNRFTFGAVAKHEAGPMTYSFSAAYGRQTLNQTRAYTVGGTPFTADADVKGDVFSADARVSYLQDFDPAYVRWGLGLGVYHSWQDGFSETGTGTMNWMVDASSQTDVILRPSIEIGRSFGLDNEQGRMFLSLGVAHLLTDPDHTVYGSIAGSGAPGSLAHQFKYDRTTAEIGIGLDFQPSESLRVSLRGEGKFSDNTTSGSLSASLRWSF